MKKTILITGSTDGIGKLATLKLAREGHKILMHGRNQEKVTQAVLEIKEKANNADVHGYTSDLSDLNSVDLFAEKVMKDVSQLDVIINNAGIFKTSKTVNNEGLDIRFVVNYLAPYKLTEKLLPILAASRIVNLSSAAQTPVSLKALTGREKLSDQEAYAQSKLALTMWSFDLATRLKPTTVIAVNPGSLLNTKMVQEAYGQHWSSADKGADILYDLAISDQYANVTNQYFDNDKGEFSTAHPDAYDKEKITELINATASILSSATN